MGSCHRPYRILNNFFLISVSFVSFLSTSNCLHLWKDTKATIKKILEKNIHTHTNTHTYTHTYIYTHMHTYIHTHIQTHIYTHIYTHPDTHTPHTHTPDTHTHPDTHTPRHTHTHHIHTRQIHTHTHGHLTGPGLSASQLNPISSGRPPGPPSPGCQPGLQSLFCLLLGGISLRVVLLAPFRAVCVRTGHLTQGLANPSPALVSMCHALSHE